MPGRVHQVERPAPRARPAPVAAEPASPSAAGLLSLQRAAGNAAVSRLLARQPATQPVTDPRTRALGLLNAGEGMRFLSELRELDADSRRELENDEAFWRAVRTRLRGMALWAVELTVRYGPRLPASVRELQAAITSREWSRTRNLLMAYPRLKHVPGVRRAAGSQFTEREAEDLQRLLSEGDGTRAKARNLGGRRVHYEEGGPEKNVGRGAFELVRMRDHVRVIVKIRLRNDPDNERSAISDKAIARWEAGIDRYWNRKFRLRSGNQSLDVWFIPVFIFHGSAHHRVRVLPGDERSAHSRWYEGDSGDTAAHEFGHMLGNPDEYNLPGTMAEAAAEGLTEAEQRRTTWEGLFGKRRPVNDEGYDVEGLMGKHRKNRSVEERHLDWVVQVFNEHLSRDPERAWRAVKR